MKAVLGLLLWLGCIYGNGQTQESGILTVTSSEVIDRDYFAMSKNIEISGTVQGDAYLLGEQIVIDGVVKGDVLALGGSLMILGKVEGNVRVVGGQVTLGGVVGKSVTVVAGSSQFLLGSQVGQNVVMVAGSCDLASEVGEDVTLVASHARVAGVIGRNIQAYVGQIRLTSKASVGGTLTYSSGESALIDSQAAVQGGVTRKLSRVDHVLESSWIQGLLIGSHIAIFVMNFLYSWVVGWIMLRFFPSSMMGAIEELKARPLTALLYGAIVLLILPLLFLILLMTVLGAPLALTVLAFNIITFYTAKVVAILWCGGRVFPKMGLKPYGALALFLGLAAYFLLTLIPYVGGALALAALLLGVGASTLAGTKSLMSIRR